MQDCSFPWSKLTAVDWQLIASSRDPGKFSLVTKRKKIQYVFHLTRYMVVTAWFFYFLLLFFYTLPVSTENITQALFQENTLEACKKKKKQNQNTKHHHHGQKKKNQQQTIQTKNLTTTPRMFSYRDLGCCEIAMQSSGRNSLLSHMLQRNWRTFLLCRW